MTKDKSSFSYSSLRQDRVDTGEFSLSALLGLVRFAPSLIGVDPCC